MTMIDSSLAVHVANSAPPTTQAVRPVLILGPTEYALELRDVVDDVPGFEVDGFIEAEKRERADQHHGGMAVHWVDDIGEFANSHEAVCALGTTLRSSFVERVESLGMRFATVVHPTANVSKQAALGEGVIVGVGCLVAAYARIGRHVRLNRGAILGHHLEIEEYATIQPGANIASGVHVGRATYIGMSATVLDGIKIGAHSIVGAGAVVTKDVPDHVQVVGVPARIVRSDIAGK
jgi:sugar O-acyltransferase (sialic acid O-acetyltransferase NeuD family)